MTFRRVWRGREGCEWMRHRSQQANVGSIEQVDGVARDSQPLPARKTGLPGSVRRFLLADIELRV